MESISDDGVDATLTGEGRGFDRSASTDRSRSRTRSGKIQPTRSSGDRIGAYVIERSLGAGGMGEVYAARHVDRGELVALKTLSRIRAVGLYQFKREFRSLADVVHRNLVRLHELEVGERDVFFTMELIDGQPFVEWVRSTTTAGAMPDMARLQHALRELLHGVHTLHSHGFVHRDLKPSNVLVTPEGRVVVLDFGLIAAGSEGGEGDEGITVAGQVLGTPAYMAPEQARGEVAGPAADVYAIGVMLFKCLTNRLPFEGSALQMLVLKQEPVDESALAAAPAELRELCRVLLDAEPEARPSITELAARLNVHDLSLSGRGRGNAFVGRESELARLRGVFGRVGEREAVEIVVIRGRSGNGKSALCRRFLATLPSSTLILRGRCRERESMPYKGVDALVDSLTAHLRRLPHEEREHLRPRSEQSLEALVQVFPVFDELWSTTSDDAPALQPSEARGVAWAALRELIWALTKRAPTVLLIDDFHWADGDSIALLEALVRPPRSPTLLLLLTLRDDVGETTALRGLASSEVLSEEARTTLALAPLPLHEARALVRQIAHDRREDGELTGSWIDTIALRSGGNPFFIEQLVLGGSQAAAMPARSEDESSLANLDEIVKQRLGALAPGERTAVEIVAVSGGPIARTLVLELSPGTRGESIDALVERGLIVAGEGGELETAHDRIRELVVDRLEPGVLADIHLAIGERLQAESPRGEGIFAAADHLDAGVLDIDALPEARRVELAELNLRAGELAYASAAWNPARRYFEFAHRLVAPWLADARKGVGSAERRALCLAIAFGRAQAEDMAESGLADAAYAEVLAWPLEPNDFGQVAVAQLRTLSSRGRFHDCVARGCEALAKLGVRLDAPSWPRALVDLLRGWSAVAKLDRAALETMPIAADVRARAVMGIAAATAGAALAIDPKLALALLGLHGMALARHGYHDRAPVGLVLLSIVMGAVGKPAAAAALCENVIASLEQRPISASAETEVWVGSTVGLLPRVRPLRELAKDVDFVHRNACEIGQRRSAEWIAQISSNLLLDLGTPLASLIAMLDEFRSRSTSREASEPTQMTDMTRRFVEIYQRGAGSQPEPEQDDFVGEISPITRTVLHARKLHCAVLFGEHERAWQLARTMPDDFARTLGGMWVAPLAAMLIVIAASERWQPADPRERRTLRRTIRKQRRLIAAWAELCPDNYDAMAQLAAAEQARIEGRPDLALSAYERAYRSADAHPMPWLAGLAAARLARHEQAREHTITASAARAFAKSAYERWGATALARSLAD